MHDGRSSAYIDHHKWRLWILHVKADHRREIDIPELINAARHADRSVGGALAGIDSDISPALLAISVFFRHEEPGHVLPG